MQTSEQKPKKGKIFVLSGPSGVGKATIITKFINDPKLNLHYSISMTTRQPRPNEINGVHYYFVSVEEFKKRIENNEFFEWAMFVGNYYGTPKSAVYKMVEEGFNVVLEIEFEGAKQVITTHEDFPSIFIVPPSIAELKRRLQSRKTESDEQIKLRIAKAEYELLQQGMYKHIVLNDDADRAAEEMRKIISKELES